MLRWALLYNINRNIALFVTLMNFFYNDLIFILIFCMFRLILLYNVHKNIIVVVPLINFSIPVAWDSRNIWCKNKPVEKNLFSFFSSLTERNSCIIIQFDPWNKMIPKYYTFFSSSQGFYLSWHKKHFICCPGQPK